MTNPSNGNAKDSPVTVWFITGDCSETAGKVRSNAGHVNGVPPANPARLAEILVELARHPDPPVRLPLGVDTVAAVEAKHASDAAILDRWRTVALSTGF